MKPETKSIKILEHFDNGIIQGDTRSDESILQSKISSILNDDSLDISVIKFQNGRISITVSGYSILGTKKRDLKKFLESEGFSKIGI